MNFSDDVGSRDEVLRSEWTGSEWVDEWERKDSTLPLRDFFSFDVDEDMFNKVSLLHFCLNSNH